MKSLFTCFIPAILFGAFLHWGYQSYTAYQAMANMPGSDLVEALPVEISPLGYSPYDYGEEYSVFTPITQALLTGTKYTEVKDAEKHVTETNQSELARLLYRLQESLPKCVQMTLLQTNGIVLAWSRINTNLSINSEILEMLMVKGAYDKKIVLADDYVKSKFGATYCESMQAIIYNKVTQKSRTSPSDKLQENEELIGYLYFVREDYLATTMNVAAKRKEIKPFFVFWGE
jgi:hypothetical protein